MTYLNYGGKAGDAGTYGHVPYSFYERNVARTDISEDNVPDFLDQYMRETLVDNTFDKPFFATEEKRSDYGSQAQLNLRYSGSRSGLDPYMPDGAFLDHEFLQPDPKPGDWMERYREQAASRVGNYRFLNDDDYRVTDGAQTEKRTQYNLRVANFDRFKNSFKNFGTSTDGITRRRSAPTTMMCPKEYTDTSDVIGDLNECANRTRMNAAAEYSNNYGAKTNYTVTDHKFTNSKYGHVRSSKGKTNPQNGLYLSNFDHKEYKKDVIATNRMLANVIINGMKLRKNEVESFSGTNYGDEKVYRQRAVKNIIAGSIEKVMRESKYSQPVSEQFMSKNGVRANMKDTNIRKSMGNTTINHNIVESMVQVNRVKGKKRSSDLREQITNSAADNGIYVDMSTRSTRSKTDDINKYNSISSTHLDDSKNSKYYGSAVPKRRVSPIEQMESAQLLGVSVENLIKKSAKKLHISNTSNQHDYNEINELGIESNIAGKVDPYSQNRRPGIDSGDFIESDTLGGYVDL